MSSRNIYLRLRFVNVVSDTSRNKPKLCHKACITILKVLSVLIADTTASELLSEKATLRAASIIFSAEKVFPQHRLIVN